MRCLIRRMLRRGKAEAAYKDTPIEVETLTIGRATDQHLFLPDMRVALKHAVIVRVAARRFRIRSLAPSGVRVNGLLAQDAFLQTGDRIGIGATELALIAPPPGYDLALEVEPRAPVRDFAAAYRARAKLDLAAAGMRRRPWSWLLFLAVLLLGLAIPMVQVFYEACRGGDGLAAGSCWPMAAALHRNAVPDLPALPRLALPDDRLWLSGELAAAHHFFGTECRTCHQQPFVTVRDQACIACHARTVHHTAPEFHDLKTLSRTRCATCHKEHYGEQALVRLDPDLCADCHRDLQQTVAAELGRTTETLNASDFGADHPQFRVTLAALSGAGTVEWRRVSLDAAGDLQERSNLKFPHDKHLKADGVKSPDGLRRLDCHDCHVPEPGGARMQPVTMEALCQDCHRLSFEPDDPQRQVPHGKVPEVLYTLQEYYGLRALRGGYEDPEKPESVPAVVRRFRSPGTALSAEQRLEALAWATLKARQVSEEVFRARLCGSCHDVTAGHDDFLPWQVRPISVATSWLPKAYFTHEKHKTMDCVDCHDQAPSSASSADVLIPGIDKCRDCHGGSEAKTLLSSTCVDCHGFHVAEPFLLSDRALSIVPIPKE